MASNTTKSLSAQRRFGDSMVYIIVSIFTILVMVPIWWVIQKSLSRVSSLTSVNIHVLPEGGTTLTNFVDVLKDPGFPMWFKNSFILAVGTTLLVLLLGTLAGYAFSRFSFPGRNAGLTAFLVYMMLPTTAAMVAQRKMWEAFHLINTYQGMILIYTAGNLTFTIWQLKGYFDTVPKALEEAAIIDGASKIKVFTSIMIPLSAPAIAICGLFAFTGVWTDFATGWLFIDDPNLYTLGMGLYNWVSDPRNVPWNKFAAGAVIVALPLAILYMVFQKYIVGGLTAGGVKG